MALISAAHVARLGTWRRHRVDTAETDYLLGVVGGMEHHIAQHLSIGGEGQVFYLSYGNPTVTPAPAQATTRTKTALGTALLVMVRFYL